MESEHSRSVVEEAIGGIVDGLYRALEQQRGKEEADAFFAGMILANLLLDDPLLHDATRAILLTSGADNPRGAAILSEVHQRIKDLSSSETASDDHATE